MNDKLKKAEKLLDDNIGRFIENVRFKTDKNDRCVINRCIPEFEIFSPANGEFYEYAYYEKLLSQYIKRYLVNRTFSDWFELYGVNCLWPRFDSDEDSEEKFEFVIQDNAKKIAYRYEGLCDNEIPLFLEKYEIDEIVTIDWKEKNQRHFNHDPHISYISIADFLVKFFGKEACDLYIDRIKNAVRIANNDIGFQTIPRLSLRYLSNFKLELLDSLVSADYEKYRYKTVYPSKGTDIEKKALKDEDYHVLNENFKTKMLYRALAGSEGYAKCFVTAEYMYSILKEDNNLDYTSVVAGYLKSIEQLIYRIVMINVDKATEEDNYWIKGCYPKNRKDASYMSRKHPKTHRDQVRFLKKNTKYFDIEMGPLIWCLYDNDIYRVSDAGIEIIHDFLLRYSDECRNEHFHKDNIEDFNTVEKIRNNTHMLMYFLLGGCKLTGDPEEDKTALGFAHTSYDVLYKRIQSLPRSVSRFHIQFDNEIIRARRLFDQPDTVYDENGSFRSALSFVYEENYNEEREENGKADIIISAENMPRKMWYEVYGGEKFEIQW